MGLKKYVSLKAVHPPLVIFFFKRPIARTAEPNIAVFIYLQTIEISQQWAKNRLWGRRSSGHEVVSEEMAPNREALTQEALGIGATHQALGALSCPPPPLLLTQYLRNA